MKLPRRLDPSTLFDFAVKIDAVRRGDVVFHSFFAIDDIDPTIGLAAIEADGTSALRLLDDTADELVAALLRPERF